MSSPPGLPCPVCGRPAAGPGPAPCPTCGLPAVGEAALVVARIGVTIDELGRDRDRLLATLRAAAPGSAPIPAPGMAPVPAPAPMPPPMPPPVARPAATPAPAHSPVHSPAPPPGVVSGAPRPPSRLSPQQVLLTLGALLSVAAAISFVAVAWDRLGIGFQAAILGLITALFCLTSAWTARRSLRATEEALAAAGAALLAIDLGAAYALGLGGIDELSLRWWTALSCGVIVAVALALGRATRSTVCWPLVALLAGQPILPLLVPPDLSWTSLWPAAVLGTALLDVLAVLVLRRVLHPVARLVAGLAASVGVAAAIAQAWAGAPGTSWAAGGLLLGAGAVGVALRWVPPTDRGWVLSPDLHAPAAAIAGVVAAVGLTGSLHSKGSAGLVVAGAIGLALLAAWVVLTAWQPAHGSTRGAAMGAGVAFAALPTLLLLEAERTGPLAGLALGVVLPAVLAAVLLVPLRAVAVGVALAAPMVAVLLATDAGWLDVVEAGLLLALLAATAFSIATVRSGRPEEFVAAAVGGLGGVVASAGTASAQAWGQVAVQLAVTSAAAGAYALVAHRRPVAATAITGLVASSWIAIGGAGVEVLEAYTLPAALGLLALAIPRFRRGGGGSWGAEGAALGVALVPSALAAVAEPETLRLVLVVVAAAAATVLGTLTHRQAPFVLGAGALAAVTIGRLAPYTPLVPRWITLGIVALVLFIAGANYERRRQQAREAVAWVSQMQ